MHIEKPVKLINPSGTVVEVSQAQAEEIMTRKKKVVDPTTGKVSFLDTNFADGYKEYNGPAVAGEKPHDKKPVHVDMGAVKPKDK